MRCKDKKNDDADDAEKNQLSERQRLRLWSPARALGGKTPSADDCHYRVHASSDGGVAVARLDPRHDNIIDHTRCDRIGNLWFKAVTDFKSQLPIRRHD